MSEMSNMSGGEINFAGGGKAYKGRAGKKGKNLNKRKGTPQASQSTPSPGTFQDIF